MKILPTKQAEKVSGGQKSYEADKVYAQLFCRNHGKKIMVMYANTGKNATRVCENLGYQPGYGKFGDCFWEMPVDISKEKYKEYRSILDEMLHVDVRYKAPLQEF